jgi:hypothetical protein
MRHEKHVAASASNMEGLMEPQEGYQNTSRPHIRARDPAHASIRISEALAMTAKVLESGTTYATALYLNIQHFSRAIDAEIDRELLCQELSAMKERIARLEKRLNSIEMGKGNPLDVIRIHWLKAPRRSPGAGILSEHEHHLRRLSTIQH